MTPLDLLHCLFTTLLVVIKIFLVTMSSDPLMSCLGAVLWYLLLSFFYLSRMLTANYWLAIHWPCISMSLLSVKVRVKVTLRLTVGQSVTLGVEPHLGFMTRYLLLFDSYGLAVVGRPLWREDGSVFCMCCGPWQSSLSRLRVPWYSRPYLTVSDLRLPFSSPPTTPERFSRSVNPFSSLCQSQSHIATDGRSVSQSVSLGVEPHLGLMTRYLLLFNS
jgi:hypothetical protein